MMAPLPNCFSIWLSAKSMALFFSVVEFFSDMAVLLKGGIGELKG
jgi:hypothetical protein